jgi:hypothetical protein
MQLPHKRAGAKAQTQETDQRIVFCNKREEVLHPATGFVCLMHKTHIGLKNPAKTGFPTADTAAFAAARPQILLR